MSGGQVGEGKPLGRQVGRNRRERKTPDHIGQTGWGKWGANGGEEKPSDHRQQKKNGDDIADNDDANAFPF